MCFEVFFLIYCQFLKFLFIYEYVFKTDAGEFTLHSLDVAAVDHRCWDAVCVCKHVLIYNTPRTLLKPNMARRERLASLLRVDVYRPAMDQTPSGRDLTVFLLSSPATSTGCLVAALTTASMTAITKGGIKPTAAIRLYLRHACTATHE